MKRKGLSARTRFEIFKRDSFKCQYCGATAPDVVLCVDHLAPASKGGSNDMLNLITACQKCNGGKAAVPLDDAAAVNKQRRQLDSLNVRREQLRMMAEWKKELLAINADAAREASSYWSGMVKGFSLTEQGQSELRRLLKKFGLDSVLSAMDIAERYLRWENDKLTADSVNGAWRKVRAICAIEKAKETKPYLTEVFKLRCVLRNRVGSWYDSRQWESKALLERVLSTSSPAFAADVRAYTETVSSYAEWCDWMEGAAAQMDASRPLPAMEGLV